MDNKKIAIITDEQVGTRTERKEKPKILFDPSELTLHLKRAPIDKRRYSAFPVMRQNVVLSTESDANKHIQNVVSSTIGSDVNKHMENVVLPTKSSDANVASCYVCNSPEIKLDQMISCALCDKTVHALCLEIDFEDPENLKKNFKCESCRKCEICHTLSGSASTGSPTTVDLLTCIKCINYYHSVCHIPNVDSSDNTKCWKCYKCMLPTIGSKLRILLKRKPIKPVSSITEPYPKVIKQGENKKQIPHSWTKVHLDADWVNNEKNKDEESVNKQLVEIPGIYSATEITQIDYIKKWSVEQVTAYFSNWFPREASVFQDYKIDGPTLLLLKRNDVVGRLGLKLGPSLKIFNLILKLQNNWNEKI
ncbi:uncharacterized protein LOC119670494 [Teleopsis dalmanni]|uniref:uncharacterized protein LOC119670494 n=1 Tax=Teleopsis dalmanni TaxID=139649 RepID=UPI0018CF8675|nr:uncharacterized protein LOC119670494 [Teleopsis dalmanni]